MSGRTHLREYSLEPSRVPFAASDCWCRVTCVGLIERAYRKRARERNDTESCTNRISRSEQGAARRALETSGSTPGSRAIRTVNGRGDSRRLSQRNDQRAIVWRGQRGSTRSTGESGWEELRRGVEKREYVIRAKTRVPETALVPETREGGYPWLAE